jgi:hypothetical protein
MDSELLFPVIIADDGELEDVRRVLDGLEIEFAEASSGGSGRGTLLISNARHAVASPSDAAAPSGEFHIVVVDKVSKTIRREVERLGPDFLLQRPVDPVSLRLLVLHALYGGPERRRSERAAMCAVVKCRIGRVARKATLVDLSERGCRLMSERAFDPGVTVTITLPRELTRSGRVSLVGRVVGANGAETSEPDRHTASIAFGPLDPGTRRTLRSVMAQHAVGSAPLRPRTESSAAARPSLPSPEEEPGAGPEDPSERRGSERVRFEGSVLAAGRSGARVLIGRDLSSGGMRVARDADLSVGDQFNLMIHGPGDRGSTLVKASVVRDDGEEGWVLRFVQLSLEARNTLEQMMAALPGLGDGDGEAAPHPNVVVSEVVEPG